MGKPLILYGLADLANPSFELDDNGDPPTSWTVAGTNPLGDVSDSEFHSAGEGIPSVRGLRTHVSSSAAGSITTVTQRVTPTALLEVAKAKGTEIAVVAALKPANETASKNAYLDIDQLDAALSSETPPSERRFRCGGPEWYLDIYAATVHADTEHLDISLIYDRDVAGYDAAALAYWDRVFVGGLVDLSKGLYELDPQLETGLAVNEGDGVSEILRTRGPRSRIGVEVRNVLKVGRDWDSLAALNRWLTTGVGFLALWADRDDLTNEGQHYQRCYVDRRFQTPMPRGVRRRHYEFRLVAPNEGTA